MFLLFLAGEKDGRLSFYAVQVQRQEQAERSVLINCPHKTSEKKILKFLSSHGDINKCFTYESYRDWKCIVYYVRNHMCSNTNTHINLSLQLIYQLSCLFPYVTNTQSCCFVLFPVSQLAHRCGSWHSYAHIHTNSGRAFDNF
uniref:RL domain-containing protein n=1 Tax=Hippocampus comes TaxID=109280 RepID=A0A3Q2Z4D2_HIPCM